MAKATTLPQTVEKGAPVVKPAATPKSAPRTHGSGNEEFRISWFSALTTYLGYGVLILFGHIRDFLGKNFGNSRYFTAHSKPPKVRARRGTQLPDAPHFPRPAPPRRHDRPRARRPAHGLIVISISVPPCPSTSSQGYAPLLQDFENFYTRRLYHRICDCWNRPIAGPPFSNKLPVVPRSSTDGNYTLS
jgi:hypothetical protein